MTRGLLLLTAVLLAGCGGSDESSAPVATTEVKMVKSYRFEPETIEIRAGQTVTWTNEDNFTHTVEVEGQGITRSSRGRRRAVFDEARHVRVRLHAAQPRHERDGDRPVSSLGLRRDVVIVACAISAGIHGALVSAHFDEASAPASASPPRPFCSLRSSSGCRWALQARGARGRGGSPARPARELPARGHDRRARAPPTAGANRRPRARDQTIEAVGLLAAASLLRRPSVVLTSHNRKRNLTWTRKDRAPDPDRPDRAGRLLQRARRARRSNGHDAHARAWRAALTQKQVVLRSEMRRLWEDRITWTRLAIISLTTKSPDTQATVARLLKNQSDIGNAVKPFYGRPPATD